jgi:cbb3-type cytochrome oxidase maturation protein
MFISVWLIFMIIGLSLAVGVFIWSVKSGQFDNPKRSSALPITEGEIILIKNKKFIWRKEIIALLLIAFFGIVSFIITLTLAIKN